jgi:hypothetical protein
MDATSATVAVGMFSASCLSLPNESIKERDLGRNIRSVVVVKAITITVLSFALVISGQ